MATPASISEQHVPQRNRAHPFEECPFLAFWELTRACDLVCKHCRACAIPTSHPLELKTHEGFALLSELHRMGCPVVVLTGGDPAKRDDLVELVRFGARLGLRMALTPSATPLVTEELLVELRDAGLSRLAVSLDGPTAAVHDAFRGVDGSYEHTLWILRTAKRLGLTTQVNTSVTPGTVPLLDEVASLIEPLGVELWSVFFVVPMGRAESDATLDAETTERVLTRLAVLAETAPFDVKTTAAPQFRRVLLQRKVKRDDVAGLVDGIGRAPRGVNDGAGVLFVSHVGDVSPSGFFPRAVGNVRVDSVETLYREHPLFVALRDVSRLRGKCGVCEFRHVCGGSRARALAECLDPFASDPACAYVPAKYEVSP